MRTLTTRGYIMRHVHVRLKLLVLSAIIVTLAACNLQSPPPLEEGSAEEKGKPGIPTETLGKAEIEASLEGGRRIPLEVLVQATKPGRPRSTRTLEEARAAVESDEEMAPLKEALAAGGWNAEQRAQMVYFAGTHLSGAPEDSIRQRRQKIHDDLSEQLATFREELAEAEKREGVRVDRDDLREAGVLTKLETEVIR